MEKIIKLIIFIFLIIVLPIMADTISNLITMEQLMKWVYLILGLLIIRFIKGGI